MQHVHPWAQAIANLLATDSDLAKITTELVSIEGSDGVTITPVMKSAVDEILTNNGYVCEKVDELSHFYSLPSTPANGLSIIEDDDEIILLITTA